MKPRKWLTRTEVADLYDVSPQTVWRWAAAGRIPATRTPSGGWRFPADAIRAHVREHNRVSIVTPDGGQS